LTKNELVALMVRLCGICIFLLMMPLLPNGLAILTRGVGTISQVDLWALTSLAVWLAASVCMFTFPLTVAGNFLARHGAQPLSFQWTRGETESVAFTLLGLFFSLNSVREAAYWFALYFYGLRLSAEQGQGLPIFTPEQFASMITTAVQGLIGIWLLFGATGLRRLLRFARHGEAGLDTDTSKVN
jgi:hypothetical protein